MTNIKDKVLKEYAEKLIKSGEEKSKQKLDEPLRNLFKEIIIVVYKDSSKKTLAEVGKEHKDFIKQLKEEIKFREQFGQISRAEIEIINEEIDKLSKELKQKLGIK